MIDDPTVKNLDPCALATIACGTMLCEQGMGAVHEAADWLMGHPVFTHEFIHPKMQATMIQAVKNQYPTLVIEAPADWRKAIADIRAEHGDLVPVRRGTQERAADPVSTLDAIMGERR